MKHGEGFKRILSLICVLCLMFLVLGNDAFASATEALSSEEYVEVQNEKADDEVSLPGSEADKTGELVVSEEYEFMDEDEISETESADGKDSAGKEDATRVETESADTEHWNNEPIVGKLTNKGITVSVEAPAGSFPVGTTERMTSSQAPDAVSSANIGVEADNFSVYMLLKESAESSVLGAPVLRAIQNDVITSIEARTYNGGNLQGDTGQWDVFRLNATFALPNGQIHAGDTTVITLPDKLKFNQTSSFEIKDSSGNVVANAVINGGAKTVTLTYTDYVDNNSDITGSFYFYVQIDRDNVDGEENIPIEIDVSGKTIVGNTIHFLGIPAPVGHYLTKSGWQVSSVSDRAIRYQLNVNTKQEAIQNLTITDKIATAGFTILRDSLVITKGTWTSVHGDWQLQNQTNATADYNVTWNDDGSFTIHLGDIAATDGFSIRYTAEASYDLVDGEVIQNDAVIRGSNITPHTASANAYYYVAGGSAEGYVFTINIHKVDESGESLAGAVFNVVRVANNTVVGTITTDATGRGSVSGLLKDAYQIVEITAPEGYVLGDPVDVSPDEFGSDKAVLKTITNRQDKTSINVSKEWDDADNQDGIRPQSINVKLLADGTDTGNTIVLNEANNWQGSFTELNKTDPNDGHEIIYSVEEGGPISGYTSLSSGDAANGFTITNTHEPEVIEITGSKTWDDNDDQDGVRPENVTIRLLKNGTEIDSRTVGEAENWSWTFTDLPKYENGGTEIIYSITEDAISDYTPEYSGYNVTNRHTPGKTSISVAKVWDDNNNKDGSRPDKITIRLLADGKDTGKSLVLTADNKWTGSFTELDEYRNGKKVEYSISEDPVSGYTTMVKGDAKTGFTVTNTKNPAPPTYTKSPKTGDRSNMALYFWIMIISGTAIAFLLTAMKRKRSSR